MTATIEPASVAFKLRPELEAHEPPEARAAARDDVRLLVSRTATADLSEHTFTELPDLLLPGDLVVVNNSATIPAAVAVISSPAGTGSLTVHFSTAMASGDWLIELRSGSEPTTVPYSGGTSGMRLELPGGAGLTLTERFSQRLWRARLSTAVIPYLLRREW
jgi:S-adenosylmethionine:tRNA ribosyltransferase-isomerase